MSAGDSVFVSECFFASRLPAFFNFAFAFRVPTFYIKIYFNVSALPRSCFAFLNSSCVPVFLICQEPLDHKTRNARTPLLLSGNIPDTKGTIVLDIFVSGMPKHKYNFACVMLKLSARWTIKKNCVQF